MQWLGWSCWMCDLMTGTQQNAITTYTHAYQQYVFVYRLIYCSLFHFSWQTMSISFRLDRKGLWVNHHLQVYLALSASLLRWWVNCRPTSDPCTLEENFKDFFVFGCSLSPFWLDSLSLLLRSTPEGSYRHQCASQVSAKWWAEPWFFDLSDERIIFLCF